MTTLMTMSPFIIGTRMMQFWMTAASPSAEDKAEAALMVTEKMQAAGESVMAMNAAAARIAGEATLAAVTGRHAGGNHADDILSAGLKPYTKRVRANRRRLSK
ncbi:hypothetical protein ASG48_06200 [Aurantimonas sp. Leaf443]|nr:hypothetical protein ASG48_06200 [Aurantimonas sp. Leaf443]